MNAFIQKIKEDKKENGQYGNDKDKEKKVRHIHGRRINPLLSYIFSIVIPFWINNFLSCCSIHELYHSFSGILTVSLDYFLNRQGDQIRIALAGGFNRIYGR
jgi:hypothetical protein